MNLVSYQVILGIHNSSFYYTVHPAALILVICVPQFCNELRNSSKYTTYISLSQNKIDDISLANKFSEKYLFVRNQDVVIQIKDPSKICSKR
jgi:hypothetical protein